jgi:probable F420-dependent oxidoreductase
MQIGVVYPQTEVGADVRAVNVYAQTVEALGYEHIRIFDHVLGADPAVHAGWNGAYDVTTQFHEPFVLFGYWAALTSLELVTSVIIGPQRQTALLAKQAAEVDILTEGRFRLGLGVGWNAVEYEALGKDFTDRGKRAEEQVELLRRFWTEESITHHGQDATVVGAGIAPLPRQRPIPIWIGSNSAVGWRRAGRIADGWFPQMMPGPDLDAARAIVDSAATAAGRDPSTLGLEGQVNWRGDLAETLDLIDQWRQAGASHLAINTMRAGLGPVDEHLDVLRRIADALEESTKE